jgi:hypothetical protein
MSYIPGTLSTERVIRPNVVEDLLVLSPTAGGSKIIFDLEDSLMRSGLCEFIDEAKRGQQSIRLAGDGSLVMPDSLKKRFEFYREFYGLDYAMLQSVTLLKESKKSSSTGSSAEDGEEMKKLDAAEEPKPKAAKKKGIKKSIAQALNIVPAGIAYIADSAAAKAISAKSLTPSMPARTSSALGFQTLRVNSFCLGRAASSVRFNSGPSFGTSRR